MNELVKNTIVQDEKLCKILPKDKPVYKPEEVKITKNSYNLLLNFFAENECIKYVWLYGSRAKGTDRKSSDIDLMVDCDYKYIKHLNNMTEALRIPYIIDIVSIYDPYNTNFVYKSSNYAKIIYRKEDFFN